MLDSGQHRPARRIDQSQSPSATVASQRLSGLNAMLRAYSMRARSAPVAPAKTPFLADGGEHMSQSERGTSISMLCPICKVDLVMSERQNIEIDYCPKCRGVWLDRGELDKIIEKSLAEMRGQPVESQPHLDPYGGYGQQGHHGGYGKHGYRRKSWLQEIFD
jgi:uncharacterized protein